MRKIILEVTSSLTASTKTQMLCMKVQNEDSNIKQYFIEYPTNIPPNHFNLNMKGNTVVELDEDTYEILLSGFKCYETMRTKYPFIHAPTFILSYCLGAGVDVGGLGILL